MHIIVKKNIGEGSPVKVGVLVLYARSVPKILALPPIKFKQSS